MILIDQNQYMITKLCEFLESCSYKIGDVLIYDKCIESVNQGFITFKTPQGNNVPLTLGEINISLTHLTGLNLTIIEYVKLINKEKESEIIA